MTYRKDQGSVFSRNLVYILMNRQIRFLMLSFFIVFASGKSCGQDFEYPKLRLGISPSAIINLYPGIQLSVDKGMQKNSNLALELGYILHSPFYAQGFRTRLGFERLWIRGNKTSLSTGLLVNYRWSLEYRNVIRIAENGEFQRFFYKQKRTRHYIGPLKTFNFLSKLSQKSMFEMGLGFGPANYSIVDEFRLSASDTYDNIDELAFLDESLEFFGIAMFHLNFSYSLN